MSWQAYIDTSLLGTGNVTSAAIFDKDGTDCWASSPNFKITPEEMKAIIAAFKDSSSAFANGFRIGGEKYTTIKAEETDLIGKKGKEGVAVTRTAQALIIGVHPDSVTTQAAANTVQGLGDYLKGVGY